MRILEWPETVGEGCELALSGTGLGLGMVSLALSLADVAAGALDSCALEDIPITIHAIRAAVQIPELVRMSASSQFRQGTLVVFS